MGLPALVVARRVVRARRDQQPAGRADIIRAVRGQQFPGAHRVVEAPVVPAGDHERGRPDGRAQVGPARGRQHVRVGVHRGREHGVEPFDVADRDVVRAEGELDDRRALGRAGLAVLRPQPPPARARRQGRQLRIARQQLRPQRRQQRVVEVPGGQRLGEHLAFHVVVVDRHLVRALADGLGVGVGVHVEPHAFARRDAQAGDLGGDGGHRRVHGHAPLGAADVGAAHRAEEAVVPVLAGDPADEVEAVLALVEVEVPVVRLAVAGAPAVLRDHHVARLRQGEVRGFERAPAVRRADRDGRGAGHGRPVQLRRQQRPVAHRHGDGLAADRLGRPRQRGRPGAGQDRGEVGGHVGEGSGRPPGPLGGADRGHRRPGVIVRPAPPVPAVRADRELPPVGQCQPGGDPGPRGHWGQRMAGAERGARDRSGRNAARRATAVRCNRPAPRRRIGSRDPDRHCSGLPRRARLALAGRRHAGRRHRP